MTYDQSCKDIWPEYTNMQITMYFWKTSILLISRPSWGTEIAAVEIHFYLCKTSVGGIGVENVVTT